MTRGMQRAHCSPVTLDRRNSATLHRPQSREMPAASIKNKKGLNLFCRKKKIQGWERRKRILSLKMTKLQNGSAQASPKGQAARQTMQESPCRIPTTFFFPLASISATATLGRQIQQTEGNAIHHRGREHRLKTQGFPTG